MAFSFDSKVQNYDRNNEKKKSEHKSDFLACYFCLLTALHKMNMSAQHLQVGIKLSHKHKLWMISTILFSKQMLAFNSVRG